MLGVNPPGFRDADFRHSQDYHFRNNSQMAPGEFASYGGNLNNFGQLYGDTSWYKQDGSLTAAAPQGTLPAPISAGVLFPKYEMPKINLPGATRYENFMPQNIQSSPLFKFQQEQGMDLLRKNYAARGLLDSGAELESARRLNSQLLGEETERQAGRAESAAGRQQEVNFAQGELDRLYGEGRQNYLNQNANRFLNIQTDGANRAERYGDNQWDRFMGIVDRMLQQSPAGAGLAGTQGQANSNTAAGNSVANIMQQIASSLGNRLTAPPPITGGPDYSGANYAANLNNPGNGFLNLFGNLSSYLLT